MKLILHETVVNWVISWKILVTPSTFVSPIYKVVFNSSAVVIVRLNYSFNVLSKHFPYSIQSIINQGMMDIRWMSRWMSSSYRYTFCSTWKGFFASAALCYGARPLLTRFPQIFVDTSMIIKTRKTHKIDLPVKKPV